MSLDIIVPVHNESSTLIPFLKEWHAMFVSLHIRHRFILTEDGSTDGTPALIRSLIKRYPILHLHSPHRLGYRRAILRALPHSRTTYILHVDSDRQYDPRSFSSLWRLRNHADIVMGYRVKRKDGPIRNAYSILFHIYANLLFPLTVRDPSCPLVLYRKDRIRRFHSDLSHLDEGFWWGFSAMAAKRNLIVREVPVIHKVRPDGKTRVYTPGKLPGIGIRNATGLLRLKFAR